MLRPNVRAGLLGIVVGIVATPVWVGLVRATAAGDALAAAVLDAAFTALVWGFTLTIARKPTWWFVVGITGSGVATYFSLVWGWR